MEMMEVRLIELDKEEFIETFITLPLKLISLLSIVLTWKIIEIIYNVYTYH